MLTRRHLSLSGAVLVLIAFNLSALTSLGAEMSSFRLGETRLKGGIFEAAMRVNLKSMEDIGVERALYCFRFQAGLPTGGAEPLTSWATPEPNGAFPGFYEAHYLSAISLAYAQTGDTNLFTQVNYMISELAKCQAASPDKTYLFASPPEEFDAERLDGVVWYRMHKLLEGLLAAYNQAGNRQALEVATKLAEWIKTRQDEYTTKNQWEKVKRVEPGGIQEALQNLYIATRNPVHRELARQWEERKSMLDPLNANRDVVGGHANTFLAKIVGAAKTAESEKDAYYTQACSNFWEFVTGPGQRCYATGGTSVHEGFTGPNSIADTQARFAQETCCSYQLLKISRSLFLITGEVRYLDYYERLLYNSILGSQDANTGWKTYYQPLNPNTVKDFRSHTTGCYCCNGTGMESFSKFGEMVYTHDAGTLYVNLFIPSTLNWAEKGLQVEQTTAFPEAPETRVMVTAPATGAEPLAIAVRVPAWCRDGFTLKVNGRKVAGASIMGGYASVRRVWKKGDHLDIQLPMHFRTESMPRKTNQLAFVYGPLVMVGVGARPYMSELVADQADRKSWIHHLDSSFKPVRKESLVFSGVDSANRVVQLQPYYRMAANQFFTGYWDLVPAPVLKDERNIALGKSTTESRPQPPGVNVACFMRSARAVDGYYGGHDDWYLRWDADGGLPQWWCVDLGQVYTVTKTEWFPPKDAKKYYTYKIEYSADGKTWAIYADRSANRDQASPSYVDSGEATGRFLRVTFLPNDQENGGASASMSEFKAFGTPVVARLR